MLKFISSSRCIFFLRIGSILVLVGGYLLELLFSEVLDSDGSEGINLVEKGGLGKPTRVWKGVVRVNESTDFEDEI